MMASPRLQHTGECVHLAQPSPIPDPATIQKRIAQ
eukprot:CAMPEP_0204287734 /NCGR_PEP_ID=MMETSP0468-20130131/55310_1 /ASSEMBLY_ACC=CAM_ASM_000383 /TAXON_ID=2969 /ORGANISM="Oxyrrhis marina" /LENGTH=34 /DNA_ID= /DNA_START= /DNA_END= /DNA_ORIENTATION=